jgi:hypothetical protein
MRTSERLAHGAKVFSVLGECFSVNFGGGSGAVLANSNVRQQAVATIEVSASHHPL